MDKQPILSLVIPAYNEENRLPRSIHTIFFCNLDLTLFCAHGQGNAILSS